jgi:hypothetical protein
MSLNSVLKTYGQIGVEVLKQSVAPHDATGKTQESILYVLDEQEQKLMFLAREFFELLEKGIRPSDKKPSKEMIEFMTEYARARGMDNPEKAAWAISVNQLKKGDKTHRQGGRIVYSDVMDTFARDLKEALAKDFGKTILNGINSNR